MTRRLLRGISWRCFGFRRRPRGRKPFRPSEHLRLEPLEERKLLDATPLPVLAPPPDYDPVTISGHVFEDLEANGVDDGGPGIADINIELWQDGGDGNPDFGSGDDTLSTLVVLTGLDGSYTIADVDQGLFFVKQTVPPDAVQTTTPNFHTIETQSGMDMPNQDFGNTFLGSIQGFKFEDMDADGVYNEDIDRPLGGVEFTLTGTDGQGNVINQTATSDASGAFSFAQLLPSVAEAGPGTGYTVTETVSAGHTPTTDTTFTTDLFSGDEFFGFQPGGSMDRGTIPYDTKPTVRFEETDNSGAAETGYIVPRNSGHRILMVFFGTPEEVDEEQHMVVFKADKPKTTF
jgi:hypothetical protein